MIDIIIFSCVKMGTHQSKTNPKTDNSIYFCMVNASSNYISWKELCRSIKNGSSYKTICTGDHIIKYERNVFHLCCCFSNITIEIKMTEQFKFLFTNMYSLLSTEEINDKIERIGLICEEIEIDNSLSVEEISFKLKQLSLIIVEIRNLLPKDYLYSIDQLVEYLLAYGHIN